MFRYFLYLLCYISLPVFSQVGAKNEVPWDASKKLSWEDYKIIKGKNQNVYSALTFAYVSYHIVRSNKKCALIIEAVFNKGNSWVDIESINGANNQYLLFHENNHFNIIEIIARKFRKEVAEKLKNGECNVSIKKLKNKYINMSNKLNRKYDKETNHSLNKEAQKKWQEEIIPQMLEELKEYSSTSIELSNCDCVY